MRHSADPVPSAWIVTAKLCANHWSPTKCRRTRALPVGVEVVVVVVVEVGAAVEVVEVGEVDAADGAGGEGEALVEGVVVTVVVVVDVTGAGAAEVAGAGAAEVPALLWAAALVQPVRANATARSEPAVVRPRTPTATVRR